MRSAIALLGFLLLTACGEGASPEGSSAKGNQSARILLVGVDGFEWSVILPLLERGKLPVLQGLMKRGACGTLSTDQPTFSPRLWNTIATGKPPEQHGILGFVRKEGVPRRRLYTSQDRRAKAFWNILSDYGIASDTIGWWTTYPAEGVLGLMVAQTNTREREGGILKGGLLAGVEGQVHPSEMQESVLLALERSDQRLGEIEQEIFGPFAQPLTDEEQEAWNSCRWAFRADSTYLAVALERAASKERGVLTSIYFGGPDVVGHIYWDAFEPEPFGHAPDSRRVELFGHVIPRYYEFIDRAIGMLLDTMPADATVLIVSDHGMGAPPEALEKKAETRKGLPGSHGHAPPGAFIASGRGIRNEGRLPARLDDLVELGHIADVCPTLLALLDLPIGEDMSGGALERVLDPAFLAEHPFRTTPTHDTPAWIASLVDPARIEPPTHGERERMDQLEALGYLKAEEESEKK